jgi:cation diffusion facilitator CzcD-associated flavoprotein CzcO
VPHVPVVVVGAGHSGLAMSRCLAERSIDHLVLERGEVANSWRTERWDSLRLLTPNWLTRLPGFAYEGPDPDGYMTAGEVADLVQAYAVDGGAPVRTGTTVTSVRRPGAATPSRPRTEAGRLTPSSWLRAPATSRRCRRCGRPSRPGSPP